MWLHDISDIFLEIAKCFVYAERQAIADHFFNIFAVVFFIRQFYFFFFDWTTISVGSFTSLSLCFTRHGSSQCGSSILSLGTTFSTSCSWFFKSCISTGSISSSIWRTGYWKAKTSLTAAQMRSSPSMKVTTTIRTSRTKKASKAAFFILTSFDYNSTVFPDIVFSVLSDCSFKPLLQPSNSLQRKDQISLFRKNMPRQHQYFLFYIILKVVPWFISI